MPPCIAGYHSRIASYSGVPPLYHPVPIHAELARFDMDLFIGFFFFNFKGSKEIFDGVIVVPIPVSVTIVYVHHDTIRYIEYIRNDYELY